MKLKLLAISAFLLIGVAIAAIWGAAGGSCDAQSIIKMRSEDSIMKCVSELFEDLQGAQRDRDETRVQEIASQLADVAVWLESDPPRFHGKRGSPFIRTGSNAASSVYYVFAGHINNKEVGDVLFD